MEQSAKLLHVELPLFDVNTTLEDILTKVSVFNPYPSKAKEGISLYIDGHDKNAHPVAYILYEMTGEKFHTSVPIVVPTANIETIIAPLPYTGKLPCQPGQGRWKPVEDYFHELGNIFLTFLFLKKGNLSKNVESAVVKESKAGLISFYSPAERYIRLIQSSCDLLNEGKFESAAELLDFACQADWYTVGGEEFGWAAFETYDYVTQQLARDVCPFLSKDPAQKASVKEVATLIHDSVVAWIRESAFRQAVVALKGTALLHAKYQLQIEQKYRKVNFQTLELIRDDAGKSCLEYVYAYFRQYGLLI